MMTLPKHGRCEATTTATPGVWLPFGSDARELLAPAPLGMNLAENDRQELGPDNSELNTRTARIFSDSPSSRSSVNRTRNHLQALGFRQL